MLVKIELVQYHVILTWCKQEEAKTTSSYVTYLHFQTFECFVFLFYDWNCTFFISFVFDIFCKQFVFEFFWFILVLDFSKHLTPFENSCWFLCADLFWIEFRFYETFTVIYRLKHCITLELLNVHIPTITKERWRLM